MLKLIMIKLVKKIGEKMDCVFCKIINGEIPSAKIYENNKVIAFLDISPVNKGHTLVVPKKHSENLLEDNDEDLKECIILIKKLSKAIIKAINAEGINVISNIKPAAGQVIMHTHFHLIPRFKNDGLKHWPQGSYNENEMIAYKIKISENLINNL